MSGLGNFFKNISEKIYKLFGQNTGNMLLATSIIGTTLSSIAQITMICFNDKYSTSQKAYMIPQEIMECLVSAASIFIITRPLQNFAKKTIKTGKFLPKNIIDYTEKQGLAAKRGKANFDLRSNIENIIAKIESSDKFISSNGKEKSLLLSEHKNILNDLDLVQDSASALASTAGAALSAAIAVPLIRNQVASYYQKINIEAYDKMTKSKNNMEQPQLKTYSTTYSAGLKV